MTLNNLPDYRQTCARTPSKFVAAVETLEDSKYGFLVSCRNADAIITDVIDPPAVLIGETDFDPLLGPVIVLDRITDQIQEQFAYARPVAIFVRQRNRNSNFRFPFC
jgi:hypothetical protein